MGGYGPVFTQRNLLRRRAIVPKGKTPNRHRVWSGLPIARVPLPDEAAPVFNREIYRFRADLKGGLLIAVIRCSNDVHFVESALRKIDLLSLCDHRIRRPSRCRRKLEIDPVQLQMTWKHFSGKGIAVCVESARRL